MDFATKLTNMQQMLFPTLMLTIDLICNSENGTIPKGNGRSVILSPCSPCFSHEPVRVAGFVSGTAGRTAGLRWASVRARGVVNSAADAAGRLARPVARLVTYEFDMAATAAECVAPGRR